MPSTFVYPAYTRKSFTMNLIVDDVKALLVRDSYRPNAQHENLADVAGWEIEAEGYEPGGKSLVGKRPFFNAEGEGALTAENLAWIDASIRARGVILYHVPTECLICHLDFGDDRVSVAGSFRVAWDAAGIISNAA